VETSIIFVAGSYKAHTSPLLTQDKLLQFHLRHLSLFPIDRHIEVLSDGGEQIVGTRAAVAGPTATI
jgi:hypothetical protein